ncbi:MAG: pyruvate dehydrogenase [Candidatus Brocadia sp.]|jgi:pyruvate dehydrogenase E1 component alpha subunit|nr:Acetoin:2,6-dichlorophenolindophenol oxidoreductase subunit alpha [Candidatus Brocadia fulgida]MCC6324852.1 thiamine pyrophosphate-dependent dehydrogenase E1 component subunit alpha [Candidatus Brocadia sp.]MCE7910129.1 thiamine pyrophosphate-dependent dehydrogenase E1 component subunit alpha [Candidatus Brocadia sp. AMX3]OQY98191.1 MAG: pyruvate dehydrogenase [Candidatus Brocadia sp. UTAMX2]MDG5996133.1 thiamine pyrophosphate-dependent dehydrogenase E1 component subunit alpha [Candidatus Br
MDIKREDLLRLYYYLKLTRRLEDRVTSLYHQGKILGGAWTSNGTEAVSVGYGYALEKNDIAAPYFRDMGVFLIRGITAKRIMAQYFGKKTGVTGGKEGNVHVGDLNYGVFGFPSHLADNYPIGAGAALAFKIRGEKRVAVACTGDGGTSRGDFHEGMNIAAVRKLPIVFICNNNQYAYSTPLKLQMAIKDVAERALAYGIPSRIVDGNNVVEVYTAAKEAYEIARNGGGPAFIECKTMRMHGHSEHDSAKYVPRELLEEWKKKDPLLHMETYLMKNHISEKEELDSIDLQAKKEIEEAEAFAEESPYPEPGDVLRGVYATSIEEEMS